VERDACCERLSRAEAPSYFVVFVTSGWPLRQSLKGRLRPAGEGRTAFVRSGLLADVAVQVSSLMMLMDRGPTPVRTVDAPLVEPSRRQCRLCVGRARIRRKLVVRLDYRLLEVTSGRAIELVVSGVEQVTRKRTATAGLRSLCPLGSRPWQ